MPRRWAAPITILRSSKRRLSPRPGEKHGWDGFATWQDKDGTCWVFASISPAVISNDSALKLNGPTPHGGIVAFKVDDTDGNLRSHPVWVSRGHGESRAAPHRQRRGDRPVRRRPINSRHALRAECSHRARSCIPARIEIPTYAELSGVSVGDGHAFFTDHDNVLYSFGIGLEH